MTGLTDKLWPAFRAETGEQLEALELALLRAHDRAAIDVNALFRHFHTIKGACAMMGFGSMGALAHAGEDLLDPVRRGERALDETITDLLLQTIDGLKSQMQWVEAHRSDPPPREDLVTRLRGLAGNAPAAANAAGRTDPAPAAATAAPLASTIDITSFVDAAGAFLPALFTAPAPAAAIDALLAAAQDSGLAAIARLLVRPALVAGDDDAARLDLLADLLSRVQYLEQTADTDCGSARACERMRATQAPALDRAGKTLGDALQAVAAGGDGARDAARAALPAAAALLRAATLCGLPHSARLLALVRQLLRDLARGHLVSGDELAGLLAVAAGLPAELPADLQEDAPYVAMTMQLQERLQQAAVAAASGRDHEAQLAEIRERVDVSSDLLASLLPPALDTLLAAIGRHEQILEIEADLESTRDAGQAFVAWIAQAGTLISNQTVFHREAASDNWRESTRLRFLAALPLPPEEIKRVIGEFDPQRRYFDLRLCNRADAAATAPAAPAATHTAHAAATNPAAAAIGNTLRIDSAALDAFVNRVGEMVTLRNMMSHALQARELAVSQRRARALLAGRSTERPLSDAEYDELRHLLANLEQRDHQLEQTDLRVQGTLARLQEDVLALRVVPIGLVFNRLPRVVRDVSHAQQKQVNLELVGEDVRIDKGLVDILLEPLMHLVRNAVDHGVEPPAMRRAAGKPETAMLSLHARQLGNMLVVEIADDGRGLDSARIAARALAMGVCDEARLATLDKRAINHFIFLPGFSTAEQITEVSGRGVGMDVVKTRIAQAGGFVEVDSRPGAGTTFRLKLPLTVAIQGVILVEAGGRQLAIPERSVTEVIGLPADALQTVQGQACCLLRGITLPLYQLSMLLGDADSTRAHTGAGMDDRTLEVVVITDGLHRIGLVVDHILGRPEVFVRDIHPDIARLPGVGGASILGDGQVVIIVDCENLFELALRQAQSLRSLLRAS